MDFEEAKKARAADDAEELRGEPTPLVRAAEGLHGAAFASVGAAILLSPLFFASWEMWWFWPMAGLVFLGCLFCGAGALVESALIPRGASHPRHRHMPLRALAALSLCVPFLAYALLRAAFPSGPGSPLVAMEAERSLLLFFTPVAVALVTLLSSRPAWRHGLLWAAVAVAAAVSAIGLWQHATTGDTRVFWVPGTDFNYLGRLSGTFFCPNHFAAYANLFVCLLVGAALTPRVGRWKGALFALGALAFLVPDYLSLSRGGFGSLVAGLALALPIFGLRGRAPWKRLVFAVFALALAAGLFLAARYGARTMRRPIGTVAAVAFETPRTATLVRADGSEETARAAKFEGGAFELLPAEEGGKRRRVPTNGLAAVRFSPRPADRSEGRAMGDALRAGGGSHYGDVRAWEGGVWMQREYNPLMNRLAGHGLWRAFRRAESGAELRATLSDAFWFSFDRGQYIGSALRAWRSNPVWGIGPGQHSNRWAEFEASADGVRPDPAGDPAAFKRPRQRDYGKHLYEVHSDWTQLLEEYGLAGLALFLVPFVGVAWILASRQRSVAEGDGPALARSLPLGALLYFVVLALHSFGDFSLQMPCLVWLWAFVLSSAVLENGLDEARR